MSEIVKEYFVRSGITLQQTAAQRRMFHKIYKKYLTTYLSSITWKIFRMLIALNQAVSNVQDIPGIFQEYSKNYFINQLSLMGKIFNGIFLCTQLFVVFVPFLMEYFKNILQVRPGKWAECSKNI